MQSAVNNPTRVSKPGDKLEPYLPLVLLLVTLLSAGFFLLASHGSGGPGFPLDDAWIHQVYARNLAQSGEWAFLPGEPSAGSTAPLWSLSLALGRWLGINFYVWTYALGVILLWGLSWLGMLVFRGLTKAGWRWALAVGVFLALEWHLVWAALSGMETLLQACLIMLVLLLLLEENPRWLLIGLVIGLSIWVRPDGITLLGPALLILLANAPHRRKFLRNSLRLALGIGSLAIPYLYFNWRLAGAVLPNTFFAKQAEYAAELTASLLSRLLEQASLPAIGAGVLILPGFVYFLWFTLQRKRWSLAAGALWCLGYLGMYALRLPVTYQHGRYAMPAMPVYFVWGLAGVFLLTGIPVRNSLWVVMRKTWLVSIAAVMGVFFVLGADAYRTDVAVIESEMVVTAKWIAVNTDPGTLVAAHDIGALGYFGERQLLDLAGLVSPEVVPFIRDEKQLAKFLDERKAEYLVTFPGWYPDLTRQVTLVFQTQGEVSPKQGGENMAVYRWR